MVENKLIFQVPIIIEIEDLPVDGSLSRKVNNMFQWCKINSNNNFNINVTIDQVAVTATFHFESDADAALFKIFWN